VGKGGGGIHIVEEFFPVWTVIQSVNSVNSAQFLGAFAVAFGE